MSELPNTPPNPFATITPRQLGTVKEPPMNPNDVEDVEVEKLALSPGEIVVFTPPPVYEVSVKRLHFQHDGSAIGEQVYLQRVENLCVESIVALVNQTIGTKLQEG